MKLSSRSRATRRRWKNPKIRNRYLQAASKRMKREWADPLLRAKRVAELTHGWKSPNRRKKSIEKAERIKNRYANLLPTQVAWAAGLFEGEGCIAHNPGYGRMVIHLTDADVIKKFQKIVGGELYGPKKPSKNRKPIYTWQIMSSAVVLVALDLLYPYMGGRRKKKAREIQKILKRFKFQNDVDKNIAS